MTNYSINDHDIQSILSLIDERLADMKNHMKSNSDQDLDKLFDKNFGLVAEYTELKQLRNYLHGRYEG